MADEMPRPDDDDLVARSREGDPRALAVLYERHAHALFRYVLHRTSDRVVAEDVVQESFLRILEGRGRYEGTGRFRAWLFTVASRQAQDVERTRRRRSEIRSSFAPDLRPRPEGDPLERVRRHEILAGIDAALADLPVAYAETFQLRICEGFSYREIGEMLDEPEGTLRSRVHHALRRVRAHLSSEEAATTPPESTRGGTRHAREGH